jgi:hypothetical protein
MHPGRTRVEHSHSSGMGSERRSNTDFQEFEIAPACSSLHTCRLFSRLILGLNAICCNTPLRIYPSTQAPRPKMKAVARSPAERNLDVTFAPLYSMPTACQVANIQYRTYDKHRSAWLYFFPLSTSHRCLQPSSSLTVEP